MRIRCRQSSPSPIGAPIDNPISVDAGTAVVPDFEKYSEVPGWVWCSAEDTRAGWVPRAYLTGSGCNWRVTRDYNAIELSIEPGERLTIETRRKRILSGDCRRRIAAVGSPAIMCRS